MVEEEYDVIVVGAGATGLAAALALSARQRSVLLLDAGPEIAPRRRGPVTPASEAAGAEEDVESAWATDHNRHLFVRAVDSPYDTPVDAPFQWVRGWQVGGRLHTWGRVSLRASDRELFKGRSHDSLGVDWPIEYASLEKAYGQIEQLLQVCGSREGAQTVPDGNFLPALPRGPGEEAFRSAIARSMPGQRVLDGRLATASPFILVRQALQSGRVEIRPESVVSRIETDPSTGRATGVVVVNAKDQQTALVRAKVICLSASPIQSVRILLDSRSSRHPNGLGNSSGLLGCHLMDHVTVMVAGVHEHGRLDESLDASLKGASYTHVPSIMPDDPRALNRPYGVALGIFHGVPPVYPRSFRRIIDEAKRRRAIPFWMQAFGEVLPRAENRVVLTDLRDRTTAAIPKIELRYSDEERALAKSMTGSLYAMAKAAGFEVLHDNLADLCPGASVHEMGGARMGLSPADSVVRSDNRLWDADNVYVLDGACWPTSGWHNPALTMMAIAFRAGETMDI